MTIERAFAVASATFPRPPENTKPYGWRVSRDVWEALVAAFGTGDPGGPSPDAQLLGEPIEVDDALPPDSMFLEAK